VSKTARDRTPMAILSRLTSRWLRASFMMAAILVGIHAATRVELASSSDTISATSTATPIRALHSAPSYGTAFASRSASRLPDRVAAVLPESSGGTLAIAVNARSLTPSGPEQPNSSVVSRGYDATAPPPLS
jgi:hypothetical protein